MAGTDRITDRELDALFDVARAGRDAPQPTPDFMARVLADALAEQARFTAPVGPARVPRWRQFLAAIGGWPAMGGLVTAAVAGLWLGISPPAALSDLGLAALTGTGAASDLDGFTPGLDHLYDALEEG